MHPRGCTHTHGITHLHKHRCTHTRKHKNRYTHTNTHAYPRTYIDTRKHTHTHTHTHRHRHRHRHTHTHARTRARFVERDLCLKVFSKFPQRNYSMFFFRLHILVRTINPLGIVIPHSHATPPPLAHSKSQEKSMQRDSEIIIFRIYFFITSSRWSSVRVGKE